jgi:hypothetical protein
LRRTNSPAGIDNIKTKVPLRIPADALTEASLHACRVLKVAGGSHAHSNKIKFH